MDNISPRRWLVAILLLVCAVSAPAIPPRPISEAERAAVEISARYLSRGPSAIVEHLASTSPLRTLQGAALNDEIEARLGPWNGARWELQTVVPALAEKAAAFTISYPSGTDDTIVIDMTSEGGVFKVVDLRPLVIPSTRVATFAAAAPAAAEPKEVPKQSFPLALGGVAAILGVTGALLRRKQGTVAILMMAAAGAIVLAFAALKFVPRRADKVATEAGKEEGPQIPRLGALLEMRRAMASGTGAIGAAPAGCQSPVCRDAAALWKAQTELQQMHLAEAEAILNRYPRPSGIPLAEILRGRAALLKSNEADSAAAYEHAVNMGPGRDALWYETAQALMALGYEDRARRYFARLEKVGSREPDAYYILSLLSGSKQKKEEAAEYIRRAWNMRPAQRENIVGTAAFWFVLRDPSIVPLISISSAQEATFASPAASTRSISVPEGTSSRMSGEFLHLQIGEAEMHVPGGAALAPQGAAVVDAGAWAREEEERGLREFPQLAAVARSAGALAQPALRRRLMRTANALADHNRWADLISLTDGMSPKSEFVPAELFFLRTQALQRMQRAGEGRAILRELAGSNVLLRRRDASALEELGEMLASHELYDVAISVFDRAQSIRPNPFIDDRVRQLQMNKRLATKYGTHRTEHFEIHYPEDVSPLSAQTIGEIAEAEFRRMQKWIPTPAFTPVVINVVWWNEFRSTYTGSDFIVGFYNGKVTVPLAGVPMYIPEVVAILTHEIAHAMIAQASNDQAPRWFQEGLAQRVEMREYHRNAFNMYEDDRLIAVSLIDAVLSGSPDPGMITEGYIESQTLIRYLEASKGEKSVPAMIAAFRAGATTEEAIQQVTGLSMADFDLKLREWGRSRSGVFENPPPIYYDSDDGSGLRWTKRKS
jgi:tetratricopeptide (TPR) repeat protein